MVKVKTEEMIEILENLYNIRMGQCGFMPPYETSKEARVIISIISTLKLFLSVSKAMPKKKELTDLENPNVMDYSKGYYFGYNLCHDEFTAWIVGRMEEIEKVIKSSELNADARAWQVEAYSDKFGTIDYVKGEEHSKRTIDNLATAIKTMILGGEKKPICKFICPHIVFINEDYYWVNKIRPEHPLRKGETFRCHHCHKDIIPRKQGSGKLTIKDLAERGIYPQEADMI